MLKPGGKIVLSFLDFRVASHWGSFEANVRDIGVGAQPMNVFVCPDMLRECVSKDELTRIEGAARLNAPTDEHNH